jgi:ribosomal protein S18 acetylase RimI-like enzyme
MDFSIRELRIDDAERIAPVHVRSWQAAYPGLIDQAVLDGLEVAQRVELWIDRLSGPIDGARLVVERGGEVVGFLVAARRSPETEGAAEVFSIYLDPSVWRGGIGSALLDAGVATLREGGPLPIILWVVEGNERACRFYEARGWYFDGGRRSDPIGDGLVPHLRYRLD